MKNKGVRGLLLVLLLVVLAVSMGNFVSGEVLINEFLPQGTSDPDSEWLELFNNGVNPINITDWNITDGEGLFTIPNISINSQEFIIFVENFTFFNLTYPSANLSGIRIIEYGPQTTVGLSFANGGDQINLTNSSGVVDNITYTSSSPSISIGRFLDASSNIISLAVQTPGTANDNLPPSFNSWLNGLNNNSNISGILNIAVNITDLVYTVNTSFLNFNNSNFSMDKNGDLWNFTWNTLFNNNGRYNFTISFNDSVGLASTSILYNITVDNQAPSVSFINQVSNSNVSGTINITISAIDSVTGIKSLLLQNGTNGINVSLNISKGNSFNGNYTFVLNTQLFSDAPTNFTINAVDFSNNSNRSEFITLNLDNTKPSVIFVKPLNNANVSGSFNITVTAIDVTSGVKNVTFQNGTNGNNVSMPLLQGTLAASNWSITLNSAEYPDGLTNFTITANDFSGNANNTEFVTLTIDNTNPAASFVTPSNNSSASGTINVTITATDSTSGVRAVSLKNGTGTNLGSMLFLGGSINAGNWTLQFDTTALIDGTYNLTINATDFAGNSNSQAYLTVTVDNSGPVITFNSPVSNANLSGINIVNVTVTDAVTQVNNVSITLVNGSGVVFNFTPTQSGNDYNQSINTAQFSDGSYNISVFANGTVGKKTFSNLTITIDNTAPRIKVVTPSNNSFVNSGFQQIIFNITDAPSRVKTGSINSTTFKYTFSGFAFSVNSLTFDNINNGFFANGTVDLGSNEAKVNITITAQDHAGNTIPTVFWTYTIDLTNPKVTDLNKNDTDSKVRSSTPLNITVNVTNGAAGIIAVNISNSSIVAMSLLSGDIWNVTTTASALGCSADGNCTIKVNAFDGAGNTNSSVSMTLLVDNTNPKSFNISATDSDLKVRSTDSITINVTVNDTNFDSGSTVTVGNSSTVSMSNYPTTNQTTKWSVTTNASALGCSNNDGTCTLRFAATDIVGNINNSETLILTVDNIAPNVSISMNSSTSVKNITVLKINVTAADTNAVLNVSINGTQLNNTGSNIWSTTNATYQLCPGVLDSACTLTVTAYDEVGNVNNSEKLTLTISSFSPAISGIPDVAFAEDGHNATLNLSQFITDSDTAIADITVSVLNNINVTVAINQTTKIVNISANANFNGSENIIFSASDGVNSNSDTIRVTVNPVNDAPTVPSLSSPSNNSNISTTSVTLIWPASSDPDQGDSITYFVFFGNSSQPGFNTSTSSTNVTVNNLTKSVTYFWKVIASDSNLNSSNSSTFRFLEVSNRAPVQNRTISNVTLTEDVSDTSIDLDNYFSDEDNDALSFTSTTPSNIAVSINSATHIVNLTPNSDFVGTNTITFIASDGTNSTTSNTVNLTVQNANDAPRISSFSPLQNTTIASQTGKQRFEVVFTDIDAGDSPTTSWFRNGTSIAPSNSSNVTVSELSTGIYNITVIITDSSSATARYEWKLTVTGSINSTGLSSPVLSLNETQRQSATNVTINQTVSGGIDFGNNILNFSGIANLEDAFNISQGIISVDTDTFKGLNKSASLSMKGLNFTKAPIIFMAPGFESTSNSAICPATICTGITYDETNKILRFNVAHFTTFFAQTNSTNGAPIITSEPVTAAVRAKQYSYDVEASDPDGNTLTFSLTTAPSGMSINSNSGLISFTPSSTGMFNVTVLVTDGNLTGNQSYNLTAGEGAKLSIKDIEVEVDDDTDKSLSNKSRISEEARPGSRIIFDIEVENSFTNEDDLEITDIESEIVIEDIDDGDDLEEDADEFDLDPEDEDNVKFDFEVPIDVEEGVYDVFIDIQGKDENGTIHTINFELELEVEKADHEIRILRSEISPSKIKCQRTVAINTEIVNTGADDEDDVTLEILNSELGINSVTNEIELEEGTEDNRFTKLVTSSISNDAAPGTYPVKVSTYYDGKLSETETLNVVVEQCEQTKQVTKKVSEKKPSVKAVKPVAVQEEIPESEISFLGNLEEDEYLTLVAVLVTIFIGTAVFIIGSAFVLLRR